MAANRVNLLTLADREFRQLTNKKPTLDPVKKFKPIRLNLNRFDTSWDRKRGAAVRMMGVLLQEDDATLEQRVCENAKSARTYAEAADWMQREAAYFKKMARLLETAGSRVGALVIRCSQHPASSTQQL